MCWAENSKAWTEIPRLYYNIYCLYPGKKTRRKQTIGRKTDTRHCVRTEWKGLDMPCNSYWGWLLLFSRTLSHFVSLKKKKGFSGCSLKVASNRLQTTVQYASSWIWSKAKSLQHEWNARGTTISVWLHNIKKRLL